MAYYDHNNFITFKKPTSNVQEFLTCVINEMRNSSDTGQRPDVMWNSTLFRNLNRPQKKSWLQVMTFFTYLAIIIRNKIYIDHLGISRYTPALAEISSR